VPVLEFPPFTPSTAHVTLEPAFAVALTVAWNCCVAPVTINAVDGVIDTSLAIVTWAVALFVGSATLVAVTV
jgi:hypothetical protein